MSKPKIVTQIHGIMHQLFQEQSKLKSDGSDPKYANIARAIPYLRQAVAAYEGKEIQ